MQKYLFITLAFFPELTPALSPLFPPLSPLLPPHWPSLSPLPPSLPLSLVSVFLLSVCLSPLLLVYGHMECGYSPAQEQRAEKNATGFAPSLCLIPLTRGRSVTLELSWSPAPVSQSPVSGVIDGCSSHTWILMWALRSTFRPSSLTINALLQ